MNSLIQYPWPGNIRELQNMLERALILADGRALKPEHFPTLISSRGAAQGEAEEDQAPQHADTPTSLERVRTLEEVEQHYLRSLLPRFGADKAALAKQLGVSLRTLYRKLEQVA